MNINDILKKILEIPDLVTNKHTHNNKSVIDKITQSLLDNWNSAYSHISDSVKHITGAERTTWNTVTNKVDKISGKGLSSNDYTTEEKNKLSGIANNANNYVHPATHSASMIVQDATHRFVTDTEKTGWNDKYSKNEIDNKINQVITDLDWKESVATYSALSTTYPSPQDGWTVNVKDTDTTYRWSGTAWISISANSIPLATTSTDGKMSKSDKAKLDGIASNAQVNTITGIKGDSESNYRVGNINITKANIGLENVNNTSDANKPISTATQTALNGKANSSHTHNKSQITDMPTKLSQFANDAGYITALDVDTSTNHVHTNKATLDKITESNLTDWNNKLSKSGGTMSGTISWDGLTANKDLLYATGTTDWAKIQYIINSSDNCELRNQIGDDVSTKFTWYGNNTQLMDLQPTGNGTTISGANLSINGNITATNFNGTVNGFTLGKTVPANAVFTDTNTWRGVQDNLTSTATDQSLSANQGKVLKGLVDGKANTSHTHNNITSRGVINAETGTVGIAVGGLSMSQVYTTTSHPTSYGNLLNLNGAGQGQLLIGWSGTSGAYAPSYIRSKRDTGDASWSSWAKIYTSLDKPTATDVGLGNVNNTSDANKPISTATQNALNGKANSSHTHNYAGSSSAGGSATTALACTGNSATATKLATARTITLSGDYSGSVNFDGSENVILYGFNYNCTVSKGNTNNYPYCRIAHTEGTGSYADQSITLFLSQGYQGGKFGIIRITLRSNNQSATSETWADVEAKWLARSGFDLGDIQIGIHSEKAKWFADVFYKCNGSYAGLVAKQLDSGGRGNCGRTWTLINCSEPSNTTTTTNNTINCYTSIANYNSTYTSIINSTDGGTVNYANTATKATQDSDGKQINTTYVKKGMTWNQLEGV